MTYQEKVDLSGESDLKNFPDECGSIGSEAAQLQMWKLRGLATEIAGRVTCDQNSLFEWTVEFIQRPTHHTVVCGYTAMSPEGGRLEN
jgi:hypothetical protein